MKLWKRRPPKPTTEALEARQRAEQVASQAESIYTERRRILTENHFAERIRLIYAGEQ